MTKFVVGKKYSHNRSTYIYTCIAFTSDGKPVLEYTTNGGAVVVLSVPPVNEVNYTEYVPPRTYGKWHAIFGMDYAPEELSVSMSRYDTEKEARDYAKTFKYGYGIVFVKWTEDKK